MLFLAQYFFTGYFAESNPRDFEGYRLVEAESISQAEAAMAEYIDSRKKELNLTQLAVDEIIVHETIKYKSDK